MPRGVESGQPWLLRVCVCTRVCMKSGIPRPLCEAALAALSSWVCPGTCACEVTLITYSHCSRFVTPWTVAYQAPLYMSPSLAGGLFTTVVVQLPSHVRLFVTPWTAAWIRPLCPSPCHPAISSSDTLFSCHQSFPVSGTFPISQLFASDDQNTGVSASATVLPVSIQS